MSTPASYPPPPQHDGGGQPGQQQNPPQQYGGPGYPPQNPRDARAQAKAEKAYRKASRPWFKKKRFILPLILLALIVIIATTSGSSSDKSTNGGGATAGSDNGAAASPAAAFGKAQNGDKMSVTVTQVGTCAKAPTCSFNIVYTNGTNETQDELLDRADIELVDTKGRTFEATDTFAGVTVQPSGKARERVSFGGLPADFAPKTLEVDTAGAEYSIDF